MTKNLRRGTDMTLVTTVVSGDSVNLWADVCADMGLTDPDISNLRRS